MLLRFHLQPTEPRPVNSVYAGLVRPRPRRDPVQQALINRAWRDLGLSLCLSLGLIGKAIDAANATPSPPPAAPSPPPPGRGRFVVQVVPDGDEPAIEGRTEEKVR